MQSSTGSTFSAAVIAPSPAERFLDAGPVDQLPFRPKTARGFAGEPAGIANARRFIVRDPVVADGKVAEMVLRDISYPS